MLKSNAKIRLEKQIVVKSVSYDNISGTVNIIEKNSSKLENISIIFWTFDML